MTAPAAFTHLLKSPVYISGVGTVAVEQGRQREQQRQRPRHSRPCRTGCFRTQGHHLAASLHRAPTRRNAPVREAEFVGHIVIRR